MKKILLIIFCTASVVCFSQVQLVKDVNTNPSQIQSSNDYIPIFIKNGAIAYFPLTGIDGKELWRTDGTKAGTKQIKDLNPGPSNGYRGGAISLQNKLFFSGDNGVTGAELWVTDGTEAGTTLFKDIATGAASSNAYPLCLFGNKLYFSANDGISGTEIWRTDGTSQGTELFFDVSPGAISTGFYDATAGSDIFYFNVYNGISNSLEFWISDGTSNGTRKFQDYIASGTTFIGSIAYFSASNKIWRTDGSSLGTYPIENTSAFSLRSYNGKLLYAAYGSLWITDGTIGSSQNLFNQYFYGGTVINNDFYAIGQRSIIRTDGTIGGTQEVAPLGPISMSGSFPIVNNKIITPYNSTGLDHSSQEIGAFDLGTGTVSLIKDINAGPLGSQPKSWITINNKVLFIADDGIHGSEIWETDGTAEGTHLFLDTKPGTSDSNVQDISVLNDQIFFVANQSTDSYNRDLWKTGGDENSTILYHDFLRATQLGHLPDFALYLDDRKFWSSNGLPNGVQELVDLSSQTVSGSFGGESFSSNGKLFYRFGSFGGTLLTGNELWVTDGTSIGTHLLKDINPGVVSSITNFSAVDLNSKLLFGANDGSLGSELWTSDGTESGTVLIKDIDNGASASSPSGFSKLGDFAFFSASTGSLGRELWKTDGTANGTTLVKDIKNGSTSSSPTNLIALGSHTFFIASDDAHPMSLWKTDGTESGTVLVKFISNGISNLSVINGKLYFSGDDGTNGKELWISDGTEGGTYMIDIMDGPTSSNPSGFYGVGGLCYFIAGNKIWKTRGTKETTIIASDMLPTTPLVALNNWIYFGANSVDYGNELFKLKHKDFQTISFGDLSEKKFGDPDITLTASSDSSLPVSYQLSQQGIVSITDGIVKILKAGSVEITATQSGNDAFEPATPVSKTLLIKKVDQTISFNDLPLKIFGDAEFVISASSSSALPISYQLSETGIAEIADDKIKILKVGSVTITATQIGNDNFESAIPVSKTLTIKKANQTILFADLPQKKFGDAEFVITASSSSTLPVSFQLSETGIVEFVNSKIVIKNAGTVLITASQAGNDNFEAALSVSKTLTIGKADQQIIFSSMPEKTIGDQPASLVATASSGLPIAFSSTSDKVSISGNQVQFIKPGKIKIEANQSGNINFNAAQVEYIEFCINPAKPIITVDSSAPDVQSLISSSEANNFWYKGDVLLTDSREKTLKVTEAGAYKVKVIVEGCESFFSDPKILVVTSLLETDGFKIFPTVTTGTVTISLPEYSGQAIISVTSTSGESVYKTDTNMREKLIDMSSLANGLYIIKICYSSEVKMAKIIKQ